MSAAVFKPAWAMALVLTLVVLLGGCAQPGPRPLYHWEGYQRQLYQSLDRSANPEQQLAELQQQADKARAAGSALPPGFRAHLGLLNLQLGRDHEARRLLEAEKAAFAEATPYMDFLLKRMATGTAAGQPAASATAPASAPAASQPAGSAQRQPS